MTPPAGGVRPGGNGVIQYGSATRSTYGGQIALTGKHSAVSRHSGRSYNPRAIQEMIVNKARAAGLDPRLMLMIVHNETGGTFDPWSRNSKTGAAGLTQFMPANVSRGVYGLNAGNVYNPEKNIEAGIARVKDNMRYFRSRMGRQAAAEELYLMHQQGAAGAIALLSQPSRLASDALAKFYKPGVNVKAVTQNGGRADWSAGRFAGMWLEKGRRLMNHYSK